MLEQPILNWANQQGLRWYFTSTVFVNHSNKPSETVCKVTFRKKVKDSVRPIPKGLVHTFNPNLILPDP